MDLTSVITVTVLEVFPTLVLKSKFVMELGHDDVWKESYSKE